MKIRSGFVSNSSSSSFVILGYKLTEDEVTNLRNESHEYDIYSLVALSDDGEYYQGVHLVPSTDEQLDNKNYTLKELQSKAKEIAKNNNIDITRIKVYMGTRSC
jgi:hypothetical protein